jgi:hypothetical protein
MYNATYDAFGLRGRCRLEDLNRKESIKRKLAKVRRVGLLQRLEALAAQKV